MADKFYILKGHEPVLASSIREWSEFFSSTKKRQVRGSRLQLSTNKKAKIDVSTVFLGLDHNFGSDGPPILFETMVFGGDLDGAQERYCTWDQAEAGHKRWLNKVLRSETTEVLSVQESTDERRTWHDRILADDAD